MPGWDPLPAAYCARVSLAARVASQAFLKALQQCWEAARRQTKVLGFGLPTQHEARVGSERTSYDMPWVTLQLVWL